MSAASPPGLSRHDVGGGTHRATRRAGWVASSNTNSSSGDAPQNRTP
jgi:hypothetical protein